MTIQEAFDELARLIVMLDVTLARLRSADFADSSECSQRVLHARAEVEAQRAILKARYLSVRH